MTGPLRRAHFRMWVVMAALLYAIFAAGLLARRTTTPVNPEFREEWTR